MYELCRACGEEGVRLDDGSCLYVCTQCGAIDRECALTNVDIPQTAPTEQVCTDNLPTRFVNRRVQQIDSAGKVLGVRTVLRIARALKCQKCDRNSAVELFRAAYAREKFKNRTIPFKHLLAAACVYAVCRGPNVLFADVASIVSCSKHRLAHMFHELENEMPKDVEAAAPKTVRTPKAILPNLCARASVSPAVQKQAGAVLKLCSVAWLTEGRDPVNIVIPCIYLAWQSDCPSKRLLVPFKDFCQQHSFKPTPRMQHQRLPEISRMLIKLAAHIPWVQSSRLSTYNIATYINDICSFQCQLIAKCSPDRVTHTVISTERPDECEGVHVSNAANSCAATESISCAALLKEDLYVQHDSRHNTECGENVHINCHCTEDSTGGGSKYDQPDPFLPPSLKRAKQNPCMENTTDDMCLEIYTSRLDDEELTECDIPDKDLGQYLKSPDEVEAHAMMKASDNNN